MMDGADFAVEYLGSTMLPKATTGLGAVQKPLKDLYFNFRKPGGEKHAKTMNLIVQRDGLVFEFIDKYGDQSKKAFYEIGLIHYIAALRFTATKFSDKKFQAAFMPLEDSKLPSNDKVYFQLDKKYVNLVQTNHPSLMALLMRRPTGVKSVECHAFVIRNTSDAIRLVSMVETLQQHQGEYEYPAVDAPVRERAFSGGPPGDVIRTEFGEYEVYRGRKQLELKDDFFRPKGPDQTASLDRAAPKLNSPDVIQVREPMPGNLNNRPGGEKRNEPWQIPRVKQDNFGEQRRISRENEQERQYNAMQEQRRISRETEQERQNIATQDQRRISREKEQERQYSGDRGAYYQPDMMQRDRQDNRNVYPNAAPQRGGGEPATRGINPPDHQQQRRFEEQRYYSEHDDKRYREPPDNRPQQQPNKPNRPKEAFVRPLSPVGGERNVSRGPASPRGPPLSPRGEMVKVEPVYTASASNLESRNESNSERDEMRQKPVAKVPPHLVAGVKVLPTGFALPKKPLSPRDQYIRDNDYDNNVGIRRRIQEDNDDYPSKTNSDKHGHNDYTHGHPSEDKNYGRSTSESDTLQTRIPYNQSQDKSNRYSAPTSDSKYLYEQRSSYENAWQPENKSRSNYEMSRDQDPRGNAADDINHNFRKKDQEIASMFTNVRVDDGSSHFYTSGTNFEHSLGYFP